MRLFKNKKAEHKININNTEIKEEKQIKILGITFSNKLSLAGHYKKLDKDINSAANLIKMIIHKKGRRTPPISNKRIHIKH